MCCVSGRLDAWLYDAASCLVTSPYEAAWLVSTRHQGVLRAHLPVSWTFSDYDRRLWISVQNGSVSDIPFSCGQSVLT